MSRRLLFTVGVVAIAASVVIGVAGVAASPKGFSMMGFGTQSGQTISMDQAQQSVQSYLDRNFYALIKEKSTGIRA